MGEATARSSSRAALLDAALEEFSERGYEAATVAGIAARAGVTTGALYAHFESKLHLLVETIGLASPEEYAAALMEALELPSEQRALRILDEGDRRLQLLLDVIVVARRDPAVAGALRQGFAAYLASMAQATEVGVAIGLLDPTLPPAELARLGVTISLGVLVLEVLGEEPPTPGTLGLLAEALLRVGERDEPALARVRGRAATAADARARLHDAVAEAAIAGHSLRRIGEAAGLSHEQVRRIVADRQKV